MPGRLDVRRWIQVYEKPHTVALSGDGRYVFVGAEDGAAIFNLSGRRLARYPLAEDSPIPVHRICVPLDFTYALLATRLGDIVRLDLKMSGRQFEFVEVPLYHVDNDVHTLALSAEAERVAIGHLSYTLTALNLDGEIVWQQQDVGEAARGSIWSVALDPRGSRLYAGCSGSGAGWLLALDAETGVLRGELECDTPVTQVAAFSGEQGPGVIVTTVGEYSTARLRAYTSNLSDVLWERSLDGPATALAADPEEPVLVVGVGYDGQLTLFDASSGAILARELTRVMIRALSVRRGAMIAAAAQDGHVALIRYLQ